MSDEPMSTTDVSPDRCGAPAPPAGDGAPAGAPAGEGPAFRTPEAILAEKDQELGVLKDRLLRLQAEFENYKKRQAREKAEFLKFAHEGLLRELLPLLDNLDRALASATDDAPPSALRAGLEMILRLFRGVLEKAGVSLIECQGSPFDPNLMQAVAQVASPDGAENMVVDVVQQGYLLEGRVLRPATVTVSRGGRPAQAAEGTPAAAGDARESVEQEA